MAESVADTIKCVVVTPDGQAVEQDGEFVVITAHDGQFGILPGRAPLLCKLAPGMVRIDHHGARDVYFVAGGFAEVAADVVTVITTIAIPADQLDADAVDQELAEARNLPHATDDERDRRDQALRIAEGKRTTHQSHQRTGG